MNGVVSRVITQFCTGLGSDDEELLSTIYDTLYSPPPGQSVVIDSEPYDVVSSVLHIDDGIMAVSVVGVRPTIDGAGVA